MRSAPESRVQCIYLIRRIHTMGRVLPIGFRSSAETPTPESRAHPISSPSRGRMLVDTCSREGDPTVQLMGTYSSHWWTVAVRVPRTDILPSIDLLVDVVV